MSNKLKVIDQYVCAGSSLGLQLMVEKFKKKGFELQPNSTNVAITSCVNDYGVQVYELHSVWMYKVEEVKDD
jgi:hypothetical protein